MFCEKGYIKILFFFCFLLTRLVARDPWPGPNYFFNSKKKSLRDGCVFKEIRKLDIQVKPRLI